MIVEVAIVDGGGGDRLLMEESSGEARVESIGRDGEKILNILRLFYTRKKGI